MTTSQINTYKLKLYILMGPPGCGKGSLSQLCKKNYGWAQLSTGDLCRKNIAESTDIGKAIDFCIKNGKLINNDLMIQMVSQWLNNLDNSYKGIILDGFPRTVIQAEALCDLVHGSDERYELQVFRFVASEQIIVDRILYRYICSNNGCQAIYSGKLHSALNPKVFGICDKCSGNLMKRNDDTEETLRDRLKTYHEYESSLLDFFYDRNLSVNELSAEKPLPAVFEEFCNTLCL